MTSASRTLKATCLCGTSKHEIELRISCLPLTANYCHCNSCRHMSGCLSVTSIPLLSDTEYWPAEELLAKMTSFEFSKDRNLHYFCSTCGTHMLAHVTPRGDGINRWWAMCGTLENSRNINSVQHKFVADTLDGGFADLLSRIHGCRTERWAQHEQDSAQVPLYWRSSDRDQVSTPMSDELHAYCKCRGVEFWIARSVDGTKFAAELCACDSCRLASGMEWFMTASAYVRLDQISLDSSGQSPLPHILAFGTLKTYCSSPGVRRGFCGVCGATVYFFREGKDMIDIAVGLFDDAEGARVENWLEWNFDGNIRFREQGLFRAEDLTIAFEQGLEEFKKAQQISL